MNENTSGHGPAAIVPAEVKRWNWGAFCLGWIWGVGNSCWVALLGLVPIVNLVMPFVLGAKGNEWAWRNRKWNGIEEFHKTQKIWATVGLCLVIGGTVAVVGLTGGILASVIISVQNSPPYKMAIAQLEGSTEAKSVLGDDVKAGWTTNSSFQETNGQGSMQIELDVSGSKGSGKLYVSAKKESSRWWLTQCELKPDDENKRINLLENKI